MVLQQLVEVGHVKITDCMIDANNVVMKVSQSFISRIRVYQYFQYQMSCT